MNSKPRFRLHPVQWLAALSVIGFSAVGIAALTGTLPTTQSHQEIKSESRMAAAEASTATASPKPAPRAASRAEAAPAPAASAPQCDGCGVVESVSPVAVEGQGSGAGVIAGGVVGGVLGNQVGKGTGRDLATIGGAVLGGIAGNQIERKVRSSTAYEVAIRMDDGSREVVRLPGPPAFRSGDRVALRDGGLQPAPARKG
ncbi:MAG: glycine zipper 2TM domain-containing protein [Rhodocyclaceae bacterium]|nr:glycine zipper 2TM domain-containing protein [Rhodocyclaceae bacterium]